MEENNVQPQDPVQTEPQAQNVAAASGAIFEKLQRLLPKMKKKALPAKPAEDASKPDIPQPAEPAQEEDKKSGKIGPIIVKAALVVFVVIGALYFINLFAPRAVQIFKDNNPLNSPTPEPTPTPTPTVNFPPSKYASDPEVKQIESELQLLEKGLNSVEFTDDNLRLPLIEWDVNFE